MATQARGHTHEHRKVNHWLMAAPVRVTRLHGKRRKPKPLPRRIAM